MSKSVPSHVSGNPGTTAMVAGDSASPRELEDSGIGVFRALVRQGIARLSTATGLRASELSRFLKFATVGAIGMVVDLTVLNILYRWVLPALVPGLSDGASLIVANSASFILAVLSNFTWNRLWTFPESRLRPLGTQLAQFAVVNVIGLAINNLILWLVFQATQDFLPDPYSYNVAKIVAIGVVLFWNYGANRLWTYRGIK